MLDTAAHVMGLLLLLLACLGAIFSLIIGFPGTFVIVIAALVYGWATGFASVTLTTVAWLLGLALVGEGAEFVAGAAGAAGERPSTRVTVLTLLVGFVGGIIGTPFLFGVGALIGALAGAFLGAALGVAWEGGDTRTSLRTGLAAMRGRFLGFVLKSAVAVVMTVLLFAAAL